MISSTQARSESAARPDAGDGIARCDGIMADATPPFARADLEPAKQQLEHGAIGIGSSPSIGASAPTVKSQDEAMHALERKGLKRALDANADSILPLSRSDLQPSKKEKHEEPATGSSPSIVASATAVNPEDEAMHPVEKDSRMREHDATIDSIPPISQPAPGPSKETPAHVALDSAPVCASVTAEKPEDATMHAAENKDRAHEHITSVNSYPPIASALEPSNGALEQVAPDSAPISASVASGKSDAAMHPAFRAHEHTTNVNSYPPTADSGMETSQEALEQVTSDSAPISAAATAANTEDARMHSPETKGREELLDACALKLDALWIHPVDSQKESKAFHRARALIELTALDEAAVCERTGLPNAALSLYLRGQSQGMEAEIESKLTILFVEFIEGKLPIMVQESTAPSFTNGAGDVPMVPAHDVYAEVGNAVGNSVPAPCVTSMPIPGELPAGISPLSVTQMPPDGVTSPVQPVQIPNGGNYVYYRPADGGNSNGNGTGAAHGANGASLEQEPESVRAAYLNDMKAQFEACVARTAGTWTQPEGRRQQESMTFHRARALRELTSMSQTFICRRSGITNAALSQYLRCRFTGRQDRVEEKLETFITDYLEGKYYDDARSTRWFRFFQERARTLEASPTTAE